MNRRGFLATVGATAILVVNPFRSALAQIQNQTISLFNRLRSSSPIQDVDLQSSTEFNGDEAVKTHDIFWDLPGYIRRKGGIPSEVSEIFDVVVVGGGAAGLSAAYKLRDLNTLILEQDAKFGGNCKGERIEGKPYSIGAVYFAGLSDDGEVMKLIRELGLMDQLRNEPANETTVFSKNQFCRGFWEGSTDPLARSQFDRIVEALREWGEDESKSELLNLRKVQSSPAAQAMDRMTFKNWLDQNLGQVHPHLLEYFQLYCWSSFLCSIEEISALQALGFIVPELKGITTFPGGLSALTNRLHEELHASLGPERVRAGSVVLEVRQEGDWVFVTFEDPTGGLRKVKARGVVVASPKFVAKHFVQGIPKEQKEAMNRITYRSYLVGNIFLDRPIEAPSFELYCIDGKAPPMPTATRPSERTHTDICFSSWTNDNQGRGIFTVFNGLAYDGVRNKLFAPFAHDKYRDRMLSGIQPVLKKLGLGSENIVASRMTRWGHAMPIAFEGAVSHGVPQRASASIGRIHFANQDNWVNPCFDVALETASEAAAAIRKQY